MAVETLTLVKGKDKLELPQQNGNWVLARELGYSPVQMLVTAAAACGGYVYTSVLENSHVPAEIEKIEVSYTRDSTKKAEPISSIQINFYARISAEYQEKSIRCLKLVSPNCPVIQSLDPTITVAETVHFI
ncbi:OsmC family protein [Enterococcus gallinarum]|uniref:OsmC family protein n=1 Tax=Enterococcus gallinarum TaxID=1353 RepID=UPI0035CC9704